jgi:predicted phage baseplate assembly protein
MSAVCRRDLRRHAVRAHTDADGHPDLNGIDYVEVSPDQVQLRLFFLGQAPILTPANVRIDGGRRITGIRALRVETCLQGDAELDDCLVIVVDRPGDFSTYTLCLVEPDANGRPGRQPLAGFDQRYACIEFSFKAGCPSDQDCAAEPICPPEPVARPAISYLAKDYASFRQLILDRLALLMPDWTERHVPDIGIALVELLAYAGDHLSYYQDAVATEAYLDTARRRVSVRRHVRLVDYHVHEGCNARAFVHVHVSDDLTIDDPAQLFFTTRVDPRRVELGQALTPEALAEQAYELFAPLGYSGPIQLYDAHNLIAIYTWGDAECCLPRGATSATLRDTWVGPEPVPDIGSSPFGATILGQAPPEPPPAPEQPRERALKLRPGDLLLFEEVRGPRTGAEADADPQRRHVVRLTAVEPGVDALDNTPVLEVRWDAADALPFTLCVSATSDPPACRYWDDISVARGNLLLADHGRPTGEELPAPPVVREYGPCPPNGEPPDPIERAGPYNPPLAARPVTYAAPFPSPTALSAGQAAVLHRIPDHVQARLEEFLAQTRAGKGLGQADVAELLRLFGARTLRDYDLLRPPRRQATPAQQAAGIARLLARTVDLIGTKVAWVHKLADRAAAGYVIGSDDVQEIARIFGSAYAADLAAQNPAFFGPAAFALRQDPRAALPQVQLSASEASGAPWTPQYDLLASAPDAQHFVVEREEDGSSRLRFGNGELGRAPQPGVARRAAYRIGNGRAGNVGAETLVHAVFRDGPREGITIKPRNPLPAQGGVDPEPLAEVRLLAPDAFRQTLARAVTADDYARLAERHPAVQRAAALLRWYGSWYTVEVAIDPLGTQTADPALLDAVLRSLYPYRRIGHDIQVRPARYVPLDLAMTVCVLPGYQRGHVRAALLALFSNRLLPDGRRGLFHPDELTFGAPIYLSRLVAAARGVPGVETAQVTTFQRLDEPAEGALDDGVITLGPLEIARLDNDANAPDNGRLTLTIRGGR